MFTTESERAFVVSQIDRARFANDKPNAFGTRRLIIDVRLGVRNANRLYTLINGTTPRPSGGRWLVRLRGTSAEELLCELLPDLSPATRERAAAALARVASNA